MTANHILYSLPLTKMSWVLTASLWTEILKSNSILSALVHWCIWDWRSVSWNKILIVKKLLAFEWVFGFWWNLGMLEVIIQICMLSLPARMNWPHAFSQTAPSTQTSKQQNACSFFFHSVTALHHTEDSETVRDCTAEKKKKKRKTQPYKQT